MPFIPFSCVLWLKIKKNSRFALSQKTSQKIQSVTHKFTDAYKFHSTAVAKPDLIHHRIESNFRIFFLSSDFHKCLHKHNAKTEFYSNIYSIQSIPLKTVTLLSWHPNLFQLLELIHMPQIFSYLITYSNKFVLCFRFFRLFWRPRNHLFKKIWTFLIRKESAKLLCEIPRIEDIIRRILDFLTFGLNILFKTNGIFGVNEITIIFWTNEIMKCLHMGKNIEAKKTFHRGF